MKRVVITGATGAIGMALINKCINEGVEVLILCHKNSKRLDRIPIHPLVKIEFCNLSDFCNFSLQEEKEYDVFYHLAWEATIGAGREDVYAQLKNIEYSIDAVKLAKRFGCRTFIGAGSQAEYGIVNEKLSDSTPVNPQTCYGIAKFCAGKMTRKECEKNGMNHIWTRILSVYGPYDGENTMIMSTINLLLMGEKPHLTKCEQKWDYLYSEDAAEYLYLLGSKGINGKTYVIGSGQSRPLYDYVHELKNVINPELHLGIGDLPYSDNQVMYLCANIDELQRDTGFIPSTNFTDGIKKTIKWVYSEKNKSSKFGSGD